MRYVPFKIAAMRAISSALAPLSSVAIKDQLKILEVSRRF
jgi:hypothetical protein